MEKKWRSALDGVEYTFQVPDVSGSKKGLELNMSGKHMKFFIECLDRIHPSYKEIDFFELCLYVESQAIKQGKVFCGNLIRHVGDLMAKKDATSMTMNEEKLITRIREIVGDKDLGSDKDWRSLYAVNTWLSPLYRCWIIQNKAVLGNRNSTLEPQTGTSGRLIVGNDVLEEYENNGGEYLLVANALSDAASGAARG